MDERISLEAKPDVSTKSTDWIRSLSSSKFNYWAGYVANISIVLWLFSRSFSLPGLTPLISWSQIFLCAAAGLFIWTFAEYILHRYLYHEVPSALSVGHDLHHQEPKALLGVPWYITMVAIVGLYYLLALWLNPARVGVVMAFAWAGYIGYCLMHHSIHHWNFKSSWFRKLRAHHLVHHHFHDRNWGITTTVWDFVFRTHKRS